jgi:predicted transcriptional regulator
MQTKFPQTLFIPAPKLNKLHIMQEIAADAHITQAELAQRCSLSVAMVNNYMRELCSSALLEYRRKSSKCISYHLTQSGREAVGATRDELLQELVGLFGAAKERIRNLILARSGGEIHRAVLYGCGDLAELVYHALESAGLDVVGVCDDDPARNGRSWCGREVHNPSQIRFMAPDAVIVADPFRSEEICSGLTYLPERGIRVIRLDAPGACPPQETAMALAGHDNQSSPTKEEAV